MYVERSSYVQSCDFFFKKGDKCMFFVLFFERVEGSECDGCGDDWLCVSREWEEPDIREENHRFSIISQGVRGQSSRRPDDQGRNHEITKKMSVICKYQCNYHEHFRENTATGCTKGHK